jgi:transcriptional regulator with XRE-family HTH domain
VATNLETMRIRRGLTRGQLAEQVGTLESIIERYESNAPLNLDQPLLRKIASTLNAREYASDVRALLAEAAPEPLPGYLGAGQTAGTQFEAREYFPGSAAVETGRVRIQKQKRASFANIFFGRPNNLFAIEPDRRGST